jgi:hypothetical protein
VGGGYAEEVDQPDNYWSLESKVLVGQWMRYPVTLMSGSRLLKYAAVVSLALLAFPVSADPVTVRHVRGFIHGFVVLKDLDNKILASGDVTQVPAGNRLTTISSLHFKDGSLYQETSVFSQRGTFHLLSYKQVQKGPSFKTQETLSLDTSTGNVNIEHTDKDGKVKTISDRLSLPPDLANGIITTVLCDVDPKVETTLSMLVSTPKPRVVKLKIAASEEDSFSIGGVGAKATHFIIKIDIGGVTGVAAKVVGKEPPPIHVWVAAGNAPVFLRSEGPLYEDGPVWQVELASPTWPKDSPKQ